VRRVVAVSAKSECAVGSGAVASDGVEPSAVVQDVPASDGVEPSAVVQDVPTSEVAAQGAKYSRFLFFV